MPRKKASASKTAVRKGAKRKAPARAAGRKKTARMSLQAALLSKLPVVSRALNAEAQAAKNLKTTQDKLRQTPTAYKGMRRRRSEAVASARASLVQARRGVAIAKEQGRLILAEQKAQEKVDQHRMRLEESSMELREKYIDKLISVWDTKREKDIEKKTAQRARREAKKVRALSVRIRKKIELLESGKKQRRVKRKKSTMAAKSAKSSAAMKKSSARKTVGKVKKAAPKRKTAGRGRAKKS